MNEDCEYLSHRDDIWHGSERHDYYCLYHLEWCPDCRGCKFNKKQEDNED